MSNADVGPPAPVIPRGATTQVADGVHVIPDHRIPLVPNVGIVEGPDGVLVVDTAMGPANGERVLAELRELTEQPRVLVTLTHFHPEHGFGAQVLKRAGALVYNRAQAQELADKGEEYVAMFRGFGPAVAEQLEGVELVRPDVVYDGRATIDLGGGTMAELTEQGPAHTRGDQVIFLPRERVLFAGDLVENRLLPIVPDGDVCASRWIEVLEGLERLAPEIVVPGHGEPAGTELIAEARDYLVEVRRRVGELRADGVPDDELTAALERELAERYADWGSHEWIAPAIGAFLGELEG
jgi:glyoxylase-like metal-dependent hydrolase (beta-lactamase superfamily II)